MSVKGVQSTPYVCGILGSIPMRAMREDVLLVALFPRLIFSPLL